MSNNVSVDITKRVVLPEGITLKPHVTILLGLEIVPSRQTAELHTTVEPSIIFGWTNSDDGAAYDMDRVIGWSDLPDIAQEIAAWEQFRQLMLSKDADFQESYLQVAAERAAAGWTFEILFEDERAEFHITGHKLGLPQVVSAECEGVERFFLFEQDSQEMADDDSFDDEEDAAA